MQNQNKTQNEIQKEIQRLKDQFLQSTDFTAKEIGWGEGEQAILCFYSSLVKKSEVERYVQLLRLEHKKALRAEENKKKNSNSQQANEKNQGHLKINSKTKYMDQKMIDSSKNEKGSSDNKNQTNQQNMNSSSQKSEDGENNSHENLKKQQKINDHQTKDNQSKEKENQTNEQSSNEENKRNEAQTDQQENTNDSKGHSKKEAQKDQQQNSDNTNNENQDSSQNKNQSEQQNNQQQNSDSNNENQNSGQNNNQKDQQKVNDRSNNNKEQSKNENQNERKSSKTSNQNNKANQGNPTDDVQIILENQKNNTKPSSSDIQSILEKQKNNTDAKSADSNKNGNNQSANEKSNNNHQDNSENAKHQNGQAKESQQGQNAKDSSKSNQQDDSSQSTSNQEDSMTITTENYDPQKIADYITNGETIIILPNMKEIIRLNSPEFPHRSPDEPENEQILRGAHEGFIEHIDSNISLIRKRIKNKKLIVKNVQIDKETNILAYYMYLEDVVDKEALKTVEERLQSIDIGMYYTIGQLIDYLDDHVWSPFPQLLNTERPDRVAANIVEGKIAIMTDISPTAIIGPVTFFSFYQSPDDFNSRVIIGTFYRLMRMISLLAAIFLPAIYIAVVSFHFEIIPLELAYKVKMDINQIPYRPFIEALIMEITIELIREASVRLPKSIGQTIGIVGGLVIGESIVSAGLVSNLMVIIVAFTAISSFVVPSIELNTAIRVLRFPFMLLAAMFGFFGIMIGTFILVIHLFNLSSFNQPYFSPLIPFRPKELKKILFRDPYYRAHKQVTSFSPKKDEQS